MTVLGIETSCDETCVALVNEGVVESNIISSQYIHARYGGVVPELASRAHQRLIIQVVDEALHAAKTGKQEINGIAATQGPGLAGALLVGLSFGKAMAYGLRIPFIAVNHMEGHLYSNFLGEQKPSFPFLALIVSGGHTMLVAVEAPFRHRLLGQTRDDAAGEAFDKVARMLGLGYPGGPVIDRLSAQGDPHAINFPRSYLEEGTYDFSFSGIKTSVLYYLRRNGLIDHDMNETPLDQQQVSDICASFQMAVVDVLVAKSIAAANALGIKDITLAGGVSANSLLRRKMAEEAQQHRCRVFYPPLEYCMDNGAMIGYVGWMKLKRGERSDFESTAVANLSL